MAESNRNREPPPMCPCGFWGSAQTLGLCSKCYKEKNERERAKTPIHANAAGAITPSVTTTSICTQVVAPESLPSSSLCSETTPALESEKDTDSQLQDAKISSTEAASADIASDEAKMEPAARPAQRNKKRCFKCKTRLELAFVEIGRCKCDYVFCEVHRLPEQHECSYDHKEHGRKEAREKMVSPKKHVGTTLKRLDSDA